MRIKLSNILTVSLVSGQFGTFKIRSMVYSRIGAFSWRPLKLIGTLLREESFRSRCHVRVEQIRRLFMMELTSDDIAEICMCA